MNKGERISRFVRELEGEQVRHGESVQRRSDPAKIDIVDHAYDRAYFKCWNDQHYYEAHDVLEQLWLNKNSEDNDFFKGLIQAAGAFVHLQKQFEHPSHAKHGKRLPPAVRLFRLAEKNLSIFGPRHHGLDVAALCHLLYAYAEQIVSSDYTTNPWSPKKAPRLELSGKD